MRFHASPRLFRPEIQRLVREAFRAVTVWRVPARATPWVALWPCVLQAFLMRLRWMVILWLALLGFAVAGNLPEAQAGQESNASEERGLATLQAMGQPHWTLEKTKEMVALSKRDTFPAMFKDRWEEARDVFYASFRAIHLKSLREMPGAGAFLKALSEAGVRLMVVSNKSGPDLRKEADHIGWAPCFEAIIGAGDAEADKPALAPGVLALEKARLTPGPDIWFVGDAAVDMMLGRGLGLGCVLLRPSAFEPAAFREAMPRPAARASS